MACMRRGFINLNESVLLRLYKSMVRPILEYGNVIWGPHYVLDQRKLEGVQQRATKLVPSLRNESYVTGFAKRCIVHTSKFSTLVSHKIY